jgi:hypothetical protein
VYERLGGGETFWIALNFGGEPAEVPLPEPGAIVRSTADETRRGAVFGSTRLEPYEGVLVRIGPV